MAEEKRITPNGCSGGCLGTFLGMVIVYWVTHYLYQSGSLGRFENGGHVGEDIVILACYFNAFVFGAPAGGLLGAIVGAFLARKNKDKSA